MFLAADLSVDELATFVRNVADEEDTADEGTIDFDFLLWLESPSAVSEEAAEQFEKETKPV
jgi:hypothetical protein